MTQLFIGLGWLRAASEKIIEPLWWNGEVIVGFLADHDTRSLGWYEPFISHIVAPNVVLIAGVVVVAQLFASASLISGRFQTPGLAVGIFLNLNFLAAGAVNPSVFYLLSQGALALWLAERGCARSLARILKGVAIGAAVLTFISVPYVTTLEPARVIDDPAVMMATGGILTIIACDLAHRNLTGGTALRLSRR